MEGDWGGDWGDYGWGEGYDSNYDASYDSNWGDVTGGFDLSGFADVAVGNVGDVTGGAAAGGYAGLGATAGAPSGQMDEGWGGGQLSYSPFGEAGKALTTLAKPATLVAPAVGAFLALAGLAAKSYTYTGESTPAPATTDADREGDMNVSGPGTVAQIAPSAITTIGATPSTLEPIEPDILQSLIPTSMRRTLTPAEIDARNALQAERESALTQQRASEEARLLRELSLRDVSQLGGMGGRYVEPTTASERFVGKPPTLGQSTHYWP
uniref:Uncharacterized protein n=1 Tax=viral metagenome TaxID=1070528 RepID=A0A6M3KT27_9ZZZZ